MDLKHIAKETTKTVISYLTYQAVRTVLAQLRETNPPLSIWLSEFSSTGKIQDGEAYIRELFQEQPQLGFRILTVREHLANEVCGWLPEMVQMGIQQANMEHRRQQLEHMTQFSFDRPDPKPEPMSEEEEGTIVQPEAEISDATDAEDAQD